MPLYRCIYEIDIESESPQLAADTVAGWLRQGLLEPPCIDVHVLGEEGVEDPGFTSDRSGWISIDTGELPEV